MLTKGIKSKMQITLCFVLSLCLMPSLSPSGWYCQSHGQKGHEGLSEALLLSNRGLSQGAKQTILPVLSG